MSRAVEELLGQELFLRPRDGWRAGQAQEVRDVLADAAHRVWLADIDAQPGGFVAARLHHQSALGENYMIALDPRAQGQGVGSAPTVVATEAAGTATTQLAAARPHRPSGWR